MALTDPYASGDELAEHLSITVGDHDDALNLAVAAASRWIEGYCGRTFNLADLASARVFDAHDGGLLYVDDIGNATISIATDPTGAGNYGTAWTTSDFQAQPWNALTLGEPIRRITAIGSYLFPRVYRRSGLVQVTARWGWPEVPEDVKQACLIYAARLYKRRESPEGVLGGNDFGIVRIKSDSDVTDLLEHYVLRSVGIA